MRGFTNLLSRYSVLYYVQIWEKKLKITEAYSDRVREEAPLVALRTDEKGRKVIHALGNNARLVAGPQICIVNPFSHPRLLLSDFVVGEKLLAHFFQEINEGKWLVPSPIVVIHPMEKAEGGLTGIERRAFRELAIGAGAREVFVHDGGELTTEELRKGKFEKNGETVALPERKWRVWSLLFSFSLLVLAILFVTFLSTWEGN